MRNISRWTQKGGSYRTIQKFYNTVIPWGTLSWVFFRTHLFDETLKILPQKPDTIVINNIAEHLGPLGAIHYTSNQIRPR